MGVIIRQSGKQSIVKYISVAISMLATILIYSYDTYTYGLLGFLIDSALLLSPITLFGLNAAAVKFFPSFKASHEKALFFRFLIQNFLGFAVIFILLFAVFQDYLVNVIPNKSDAYKAYFAYAMPLTILVSLMLLLIKYISNFQRIAVSAVIENLIKLSLPLIFIGILYFKISINSAIWLILLNYFLACCFLFIYLRKLFPKILSGINRVFSIPKKEVVSGFYNYTSYAFLGGLGSILAFRLDGFMVPSFTNFGLSGEFRIGINIANVISIPTLALFMMSGPIIARAFQNNDRKQIAEIYAKSCINLQILGSLGLIGILCTINVVKSIMPNGEDLLILESVVILLSLAKFIDMFFGVNSQILVNSRFYKYNLWFVLFLGFSNIILNYFLIKAYGPIGAAIATCIALVLYNLVKYYFLLKHMNLQPFSKYNFLLLGILILFCFSIYCFTISSNIWFDMTIKLIVFVGSFTTLVYYLKVTPDLNSILTTFARYFSLKK